MYSMKKTIIILAFFVFSVNKIFAESDNKLVTISWDIVSWWIDIAMKIWWWIWLSISLIIAIFYAIKKVKSR